MKTSYLFIPALAVALASCHESKPEEKKEQPFVLSDTMAKMITLDSVREGGVNNELTLSGEVSFDENSVVKVFPRSSGQVLQARVSLGDHVQSGQTLAVIRSADVAGNYADLSGADADVTIAKKQMDNQEALFRNGIAAEKDYLEAAQNYQKALAARRKIQSVLAINGGSGSNAGGTYSVSAPISGYVVEKKVNAGSFIRTDMADNLFTISDLKDVWVWANVFEADIPKVREGSEADVTTLAYPGKVFAGRIDRISEVLDPTNKAMRVRIRLDNSGLLLKPEMFAKVTVRSQGGGAGLSVPSAAIISQNGRSYVIIYNSQKDLRVQEVSVIKSTGGVTYIQAGLAPGQKVVTSHQVMLFNALTNVI